MIRLHRRHHGFCRLDCSQGAYVDSYSDDTRVRAGCAGRGDPADDDDQRELTRRHSTSISPHFSQSTHNASASTRSPESMHSSVMVTGLCWPFLSFGQRLSVGTIQRIAQIMRIVPFRWHDNDPKQRVVDVWREHARTADCPTIERFG